MDELDKILLQHLPDTGLCDRSKVKQAERRRKLKVAFMLLIMNYGKRPIPNEFVTKEGQPFTSGGVCNGPTVALLSDNHGPELIIDELQFDESDIDKNKVTVRMTGSVGMPIFVRQTLPRFDTLNGENDDK